MSTLPVPLGEFSQTPVALTTRFEVLTRDQHTCQFCGRRAPEVTVGVERLRPLMEGGSNTSLNMVTTCTECSIGRRSVIARMYRSARSGDSLVASTMVGGVTSSDFWRDAVGQYNLQMLERIVEWFAGVGHPDPGEPWRRSLLALIHRSGADRVWQAFADMSPRVLEFDTNGKATAQSIELILVQLPRWVSSLPERSENKRLLAIRGVLRSRLAYVREAEVMQALESALEQGVPLALIESAARQCRGWADFWSALSALSSVTPG